MRKSYWMKFTLKRITVMNKKMRLSLKKKKKRLFKWKINDAYNSNKFNFDQSRSGVTDLFTENDGEQEVNHFLQFFYENILTIISIVTNC